MEYLIDTQIVIWSIISPNKLSVKVREILQNHSIGVCQVSLFEIAIKQKIGKLTELDLSIEALTDRLLTDNFEILSIQNNHIVAYDDIPLMSDHKDPFDRLILATALSEDLPIISSDENFKLYVPQIQLIEN
jgi:PIN domain nuclease of toxin-antitoxin system